ncbi:HAD hydrolase-like protein [Deinococcus soli (ex Cha et al. 2016)]|uniref:Phosphoglycolate phosphatase n=2 Tax=Deinococcus soli (ex Cha et al. 2016) TaxID=1309411 RepID=A0ACC6KG47_9DEIO|nr:HAD hydrolase-like protein [Deinococcus soli (ex Cha et al. 2016)]MDR6218411.1 phosphoglycolate phosphatase [Deinococcus soli (ex Cha et al. 2016)]MDR6329151.1 phosphoglycolate phosphatase [Deinococcus soli (ex Cha et al. 2016)]MDR6751424.1 phosphoglycolate phosphatase [Deinococcus soli (ex Cha et al. 2016)]
MTPASDFHIVFDFDGTLVDSREVGVQAYNRFAQERGLRPLTPELVAVFGDLTMRERCRALNIRPWRLPWVLMHVGTYYREAVAQIPFADGIPELLAELARRGHTLSIVSTNQERNIRAFLKMRGLEELIPRVVCSSRPGGKARLIRGLMRGEGISRHQVVYVGDEHRDVQACQKVGVRVIAVGWGLDVEWRLLDAKPDFMARTPADLLECLGRFSGPFLPQLS